MIKTIIYFFQSILIYLFFLIGKILGLKLSRQFFSNLFCFLGPLFKSNKIIHENLNIFSDVVENVEKDKIKNNMWKNYGMTFIEYIYLKNFRENNNHIIIKDKSNLQQIEQEKKPVIFISGHFANFELMSMEITKKNIPLATIYRPLNNFFLNPFMEYLRKKYVCPNQIKKGLKGVKEVIEFLKQKNCIALMVDQRVSEGEKIDFFNKKAFTTTLPAQLSSRFDVDIVPVYIERDSNNNFMIEFQKRICPRDFKDKIDLTKEINNVLEKMIIRNPGQWIWTHNRWK